MYEEITNDISTLLKLFKKASVAASSSSSSFISTTPSTSFPQNGNGSSSAGSSREGFLPLRRPGSLEEFVVLLEKLQEAVKARMVLCQLCSQLHTEGKAEVGTIQKLEEMVKILSKGASLTRVIRGEGIGGEHFESKRLIGFRQWETLVTAEVYAMASGQKALEVLNETYLLGTIIHMLRFRKNLVAWEELLYDEKGKDALDLPRYRQSIQLFDHCIAKMPLHFHHVATPTMDLQAYHDLLLTWGPYPNYVACINSFLAAYGAGSMVCVAIIKRRSSRVKACGEHAYVLPPDLPSITAATATDAGNKGPRRWDSRGSSIAGDNDDNIGLMLDEAFTPEEGQEGEGEEEMEQQHVDASTHSSQEGFLGRPSPHATYLPIFCMTSAQAVTSGLSDWHHLQQQQSGIGGGGGGGGGSYGNAVNAIHHHHHHHHHSHPSSSSHHQHSHTSVPPRHHASYSDPFSTINRPSAGQTTSVGGADGRGPTYPSSSIASPAPFSNQPPQWLWDYWALILSAIKGWPLRGQRFPLFYDGSSSSSTGGHRDGRAYRDWREKAKRLMMGSSGSSSTASTSSSSTTSPGTHCAGAVASNADGGIGKSGGGGSFSSATNSLGRGVRSTPPSSSSSSRSPLQGTYVHHSGSRWRVNPSQAFAYYVAPVSSTESLVVVFNDRTRAYNDRSVLDFLTKMSTVLSDNILFMRERKGVNNRRR